MDPPKRSMLSDAAAVGGGVGGPGSFDDVEVVEDPNAFAKSALKAEPFAADEVV